MRHEDITEVSDPRNMTIDIPVDETPPHIEVVKGNPSDDELAALLAVLGSVSGGVRHPGAQELNLWGHAADKLRYHVASWQRVTLVERLHMRR
jgi:hypothetical protein